MASEVVHKFSIFFIEAVGKPGYLCWKQEAAPGGPSGFLPAPTLYFSNTEPQNNQH